MDPRRSLGRTAAALGILPLQCAYADLYVVDTLWPDSQPSEFREALAWYQEQDVTLGG